MRAGEADRKHQRQQNNQRAPYLLCKLLRIANLVAVEHLVNCRRQRIHQKNREQHSIRKIGTQTEQKCQTCSTGCKHNTSRQCNRRSDRIRQHEYSSKQNTTRQNLDQTQRSRSTTRQADERTFHKNRRNIDNTCLPVNVLAHHKEHEAQNQKNCTGASDRRGIVARKQRPDRRQRPKILGRHQPAVGICRHRRRSACNEVSTLCRGEVRHQQRLTKGCRIEDILTEAAEHHLTEDDGNRRADDHRIIACLDRRDQHQNQCCHPGIVAQD